MASFPPAFEKTSLHEGGYSDTPGDAGGETYRGIARKYNPGWEGWAAIDRLRTQPGFPENLKQLEPTLAPMVAAFYERNYWPALYDGIASQEVADELFDFGVNAGLATAARLMQQTLRKLVAGPVVVDGRFGPQTVTAVNSVEPRLLLLEFRAREAAYYASSMLDRFVRCLKASNVALDARTLEACRERAMQFALGWMRRVMA